MKKLLALLLSILMLLGMLSGCVSDRYDDEEDETGKSSSKKKTEDEEEKEDEETETTPTKKEEEEEVAPPVQTGYVRGTNNAYGWKSEYLGLQFKPASNMIMSTEEELESMMSITSEMLKDNGYGEQVVDYTMVNTVYEMMALDTSRNNVNVGVEKLTLSNITAEQYAALAVNTLESATQIDYEVDEPYELELWGKDFWVVEATGNISGTTVAQYCLIAKVGDRMLLITFTDMTGDSLEAFLNCFSEY